jgi:hypothetical protein
VGRRLELHQPPRDLGHLLLHLNRGVVADSDRKQPQRSVAQLGHCACTRRDQRSSIDRHIASDSPQFRSAATPFVS